MQARIKVKPSLFYSLIPLLIMGLLLGVGYGVYHIRAEALLIISATVAGIMAWRIGWTWKELESGIVDSVTQAMPAMLIVITVGLLIGSWIISGTIPMMIHYGMDIISPKYFLITASILCSVVSLFTGSSWGTVGTVGIALMGIAESFGLPRGMTAGAIITGAYFGDKISPFSDTTNLAPIAARSNLFDHIRHLLWTTTPAWLIGLVIYLFLGLYYIDHNVDAGVLNLIQVNLAAAFNYHWLLLLPPLIVLVAAVKKMPTLPSMLASAFTAALLALIFQSHSLTQILDVMVNGYVSATGDAQIDRLLTRGGMMSMMGVTLIALCAFAFAGIVRKAGMLDTILQSLSKWISSRGSLILTTAGSAITVAIITGSSFLAIIIPAELFASLFSKMGLAAKNLSRTVEDSGTVIVPLVPWSMAGVYMSGTLGVSTLAYIPWAFMCYLGVFFAILYGYTGIGLAEKISDDETQQGS